MDLAIPVGSSNLPRLPFHPPVHSAALISHRHGLQKIVQGAWRWCEGMECARVEDDRGLVWLVSDPYPGYFANISRGCRWYAEYDPPVVSPSTSGENLERKMRGLEGSKLWKPLSILLVLVNNRENPSVLQMMQSDSRNK